MGTSARRAAFNQIDNLWLKVKKLHEKFQKVKNKNTSFKCTEHCKHYEQWTSSTIAVAECLLEYIYKFWITPYTRLIKPCWSWMSYFYHSSDMHMHRHIKYTLAKELRLKIKKLFTEKIVYQPSHFHIDIFHASVIFSFSNFHKS